MTTAVVNDLEMMEACKEATYRALGGRIKDEDIANLLEHMPTNENDLLLVEAPNLVKGAGPAEATGSIIIAAIYGKVECKPSSLHYHFSESVWGVGASGLTSLGFMYTAYDNWTTFFEETRGFHAQGIASKGGIFQINWFNGSGVPIGQFNAAAAGVGVFEVGGKGKWKKN